MRKRNGIRMGSKHPTTRDIVFDAEPIVIWIDGDPGAKSVEQHLSDTYYGHITTYVSQVNLTEIHYNCAARNSRSYGRKKTGQLRQFGVQPVDTNRTWERAAELKDEYTPDFPLADAFALATADTQGVPLLAGDDHHWDEPERDGHDIIRVP